MDSMRTGAIVREAPTGNSRVTHTEHTQSIKSAVYYVMPGVAIYGRVGH